MGAPSDSAAALNTERRDIIKQDWSVYHTLATLTDIRLTLIGMIQNLKIVVARVR